MAGHGKVKGIYAGPVAKVLDIPVTKGLLEKLGKCMVAAYVKEAKKDFAKRGWSGEARDGSAPIWDSFSYRIRGDRTIEVLSTFPDIEILTTQDIPSRRMTWLTQEGKNMKPSLYPVTPREKKLGMKLGGRVSQNKRMPLVVPMKDKSGTVVFRTAPLKMQDAWVHPGIARFTFMERAVRTGKAGCVQILADEVRKSLGLELTKRMRG
jgi:hypothetical protein